LSGDDTEKSATSPELNHGETLELDGNAQSVIDGARLISMQLRSVAIQKPFQKSIFRLNSDAQRLNHDI
jgi:hypothetical protein